MRTTEWELVVKKIDGLCADNKELRELNAELLAWLKHARLFVAQPTVTSNEIDRVISKAEAERLGDRQNCAGC